MDVPSPVFSLPARRNSIVREFELTHTVRQPTPARRSWVL
jgi:hypothetical protein